MNVGIIAKPNQKGQIVIPKEYREALGIDVGVLLNLIMRGGGIYIYPISEVVGATELEGSYLKVLEKTKGKWIEKDWVKSRGKRKKLELSASRKRRQQW